MYKLKYLLFTYFLTSVIFLNNSIGQVSSTIKTVESVDGKKRRITTYDSSMNIIREEYYGNPFSQFGRDADQQLIAAIDYKNNKIIRIVGYKKYPEIEYKIDFLLGTYFDKLKKVNLKFRDNFIFEGVQEGEKIVVEYKNGIKNGKLIQTDSAVYTTSPVVVQKVDPRFLQFNIVKFYNAIGSQENYKLFKGVYFNYQNGKIQGKQSSYYLSGKIKFNGDFDSGKLIKYNSFDEQGNYISKLTTQNGFTNGVQLLNGVPINETSLVFFNYRISKTGNITYDNDYYLSKQDWRDQFKPGFVDNLETIYKYIASAIITSEWEPYFDSNGNLYYNEKSKLRFNRDSLYTLRFKNIFDENKITFQDSRVIKYLLNIPDFEITRFEFTSDEDKFIIPVATKINKNENIQQLLIDTIKLSNGYYFKHYDFPYFDFYIEGPYKKSYFTFLFEKNKFESDFANANSNYFNSPLLIDINEELTFWLASTFKINTPFNVRKYIHNGYGVSNLMGYVHKFITSNIDLEIHLNHLNKLIDFLLANRNISVNQKVEIDKPLSELLALFNERSLGNMNSAVEIENTGGSSYIKILNKYFIEIKYKDIKYKIYFDFDKSKWIFSLI